MELMFCGVWVVDGSWALCPSPPTGVSYHQHTHAMEKVVLSRPQALLFTTDTHQLMPRWALVSSLVLVIIHLLSCVRAQLRHAGSFVVVQGFSSFGLWACLLHSMWDLSSPTRNQTRVPYIARQIFFFFFLPLCVFFLIFELFFGVGV